MTFVAINAMLLTACSSEQDMPIVNEQNTTSVSMSKYVDKVVSHKELIDEFVLNSETSTRNYSSENLLNLKNALMSDAKVFSKELGLTVQDMNELFDSKLSVAEVEDAIVGLLLFSTVLDGCNPSGISTRGQDFTNCFQQATGIAAGIAIVGELAKGTMTKAALKQAVKLVARVGGRTLSGVGLALIAAEIAYCMW